MWISPGLRTTVPVVWNDDGVVPFCSWSMVGQYSCQRGRFSAGFGGTPRRGLAAFNGLAGALVASGTPTVMAACRLHANRGDDRGSVVVALTRASVTRQKENRKPKRFQPGRNELAMDRLKASRPLIVAVIALSFGIPFIAGCGTFAQLMYTLQGLKVEAAYDGLKESRVAVVVVSDASSYGPDSLSHIVGKALGNQLAANVKEITVLSQKEVQNWRDANGWNEINFVELGRGLDVDRVIAVEIGSYSIHEGQTMYKGRASVTTSVYDIADNGQIVFSQGPAEYQYPKSHGRPAISTTEQQFEAQYLSQLVTTIARNFYKHDKVDTVAEDAIEF